MWCLGCCPCWKGSEKPELEDSGLLTSPQWQSGGDVNKTQYYTVHKISSFGRTGSGEDVSDTSREQGDQGIQSPAEFWTAKIQRAQPDVTDDDYCGNSVETTVSPRPLWKPQLPQGRWRRALHPFRSRKERNKSREHTEAADLGPPSITVSSPDLLGDGTQDKGISPHPGPLLRHAGTMTNVSSFTELRHQVTWRKSQSMQDINTAIQSPSKEDGSCVDTPIKETNTAQVALTYGLDTSLYTPSNSESAPMSRSNEALNAWLSPNTMGKADWLQEAACGTIHFTATYIQKNKKLLVCVNKVEHLPPKGEDYTYSVVVKLSVLPLNKPVRMSRIHKNNLNPEIEEDFEFTVKQPVGKVLRLSVHDADHQGKYDAIGHSLFYLEDVMAGRPRRYAMRLYKQSQPDVDPGNIRVSLSYKRETMILTVLVMEACNLLLSTGADKTNRLTDKYNTYVKVVYVSCGQKMKSRRSAVVSNNRNPNYRETFTFKLSLNFLHDCFIIVSVMMKGLLKKDVPIGRLVLGPFQYTEGQEKTPWGRAILLQEEVTHWFRMHL
ncbi:uncharacterized protein LOC110830220 [Zootermopsis nevadensis]|uniref:Synaptotagmin-15 n=1 Tax=Zootermopsis nevadensis TaxID=136037 RepID=A0A067RM01_ZOONE|nr:uncharacterized protein LOC110830220 [Zootermopsis nevadensis]XP_021920556.1 uncharacterized protein LOC110830220 [Zootermopsis nevadensis]KDR24053.1 Synaptotagmin-15 [Zootermopsis nevadensis]